MITDGFGSAGPEHDGSEANVPVASLLERVSGQWLEDVGVC